MSTSFRISSSAAIPASQILEGLGLEDLADPPLDASDDWPTGAVFLHVPGQSSRSIEVTLDDTGYTVRMMAMSSQFDLEIGLEIVQRLAVGLNQCVEPETSEEPIPGAELKNSFDDAWIRSELKAGASFAIHMVTEEGEVITVPGTVRDYHIGPKTLARLHAEGDEESLPERLTQDIRRVMNFDASTLFEATVMAISKDGSEEETSLAVISDGVDYLLPGVQQYALRGPDDSHLIVEAASIPILFEDRAVYLDESQFTLAAVPEDDWQAIFHKAKVHSVDDLPGEKQKPWWRFW